MDKLEKSPEDLNATPPEYWTAEENERILEPWSHEEQKRIIRRVDWRLVPICGLMYCVSLLDRTNLSNAAIAGMNDELNLAFINGVDRYVCSPSELNRLFGRANNLAERHHPRILHHVHSLSASSYRFVPQDRSTPFSLDNHVDVGCCDDRYGIC